MKRAELIEKLGSLLIREEETVNALAKFCLVLEWKKVVKSQYINKINEGLIILRDDTQKHMDILSRLMRQVKIEGKNGF